MRSPVDITANIAIIIIPVVLSVVIVLPMMFP